MRVLHVHSGNLYGGVETLFVALARHKDVAKTMEQHFSLCFSGRLSEELTAMGAGQTFLNPVRVSRPWTVLRARRKLRASIRGYRPTIVICHAPWAQTIFGPVVRAAGLPLVYWQHGTTEGKHWLERWARRTPPDLVLTNSRFTAGTVSRVYADARCEVLRYPVDAPDPERPDTSSRVRRTLDTDPNAIVIIQVSRMEPWKGHKLHLDALGLLRDVPNWVCWQVGGAQRPDEARYVAEMQALAQSLGIASRVHFLGQRSDVPDLLAAADIFCQPNLGPEPFGITFVEALYAGLPVVTTAMGGPLEIVDDTCGRLTPPGDAQALATALLELIENQGTRNRLAAAAPGRGFDLCDPANQMRKLEAMLGTIDTKTKR